jgi:hypothetical protein
VDWTRWLPRRRLLWYIVPAFVIGCVLLGVFLPRLGEPRPTVAAAAVLTAVCLIVLGVAVWTERRWARWVAVVVGLLAIGWGIHVISVQGFAISRLVLIGVIVWGAWSIWQEDLGGDLTILSLALLLREPLGIGGSELARVCSRVWGTRVDYYQDEDAAAQDSEEDSDSWLDGTSPRFIGMHEGMLVTFTEHDQRLAARLGAPASADQQRVRQVLAEQRTYVEMALWRLGEEEAADLEEAERIIAPVLAELIDDRCLGVADLTRKLLVPADPGLRERLREGAALV